MNGCVSSVGQGVNEGKTCYLIIARLLVYESTSVGLTVLGSWQIRE